MIESDDSLIHLALKASDPFQFIDKVLSNERVTDIDRIHGLNSIPMTQDASTSAYQIMSYLLLNTEMGRGTNLISSPERDIQDLYKCLKDELLEFLLSRLDSKYAIIESRLTRNLAKHLFMPLIYGKTVITMASDIREAYGPLLRPKDYYHIAKIFHEFWINKYLDIANLMKLINLIALAILLLLMKYTYNTEFEYGKFTISYVTKILTGYVAYTIGTAISLNDKSGNAAPNVDVYANILKLCIQKVEDYNEALLSDGSGEPKEVEAMGRKIRYPNHVPALKPTTKERRPFIVADMETVLINNVNVPYAAGFIALRP
ncbi:hypothetical protein KI387_008875, partial [Taxus chinensis]